MLFRKFAKGGLRVPEQLATPPMPLLRGRPCLADGTPARFHRWVDEDRALLKINAFTRNEERDRLFQEFRDNGVVPGCCSTEVLRVTFALVEYRDGTVGKVEPARIRFLDSEEG